MTDLVEGSEVELVGTVRELAPLVAAPLTGRACIAHVTRARVWTELDLAGVLVAELDDRRLAPFVLDTATGPFPVAASAFDLATETSHVWPPLADVRAFLAARQLERYAISTFVQQAIVIPGERARVRGVLARDAVGDDERGYRDLDMRMRLGGYRERPLAIVIE